jgi:hypothetical protein
MAPALRQRVSGLAAPEIRSDSFREVGDLLGHCFVPRGESGSVNLAEDG